MNQDMTQQTAAPTAPTDEQISAMLAEIFGLSDQAKETGNEDLYNAHTDVLQNRLSPDDARAKYGSPVEGSEDSPFGDAELDSIMGCGEWLRGEGDRNPSASLAQLLSDDVADEDEDEDDEESEDAKGNEETIC